MNNEPRAQSEAEKSPRATGRPRRQGIDSFNLAVDLRDSRKFIRLRRLLNVNSFTCFGHLALFFNYVAKNHAFDPIISPEDADVISEACEWNGDSSFFINALQTAGFLTHDYAVNDWFVHQPMAEFILSRRISGQKGGENNVIQNPKQTAQNLKLNAQKSVSPPLLSDKTRSNIIIPNGNGNYKSNTEGEGRGGDHRPHPTDVVTLVVDLIKQMGQELGIPAYADIAHISWEPKLREAANRIGYQCLYTETQNFINWFTGEIESGKRIKKSGNHNPRNRFFNNWLARVNPEKFTSNDELWTPVILKPLAAEGPSKPFDV